MKTLLSLILLLPLANINATELVNEIKAQASTVYSSAIIKNQSAIISNELALGNKIQFQNMVDNICNKLMGERMTEGSSVGYKIEGVFLKYNGWSKATHRYKDKLETFWHTNKNDFICPATPHYQAKHFLKVIINLQMNAPALNKLFHQKQRVISLI